jgi:aryl-alcohol dehydrogenase-like predicted oxidoreductase
MQYRTLPQTDLTLSLLGFGNFVFGTSWWGEFSDEDALRLQEQAVDLGVTFFDTAPAYGNGRAEDLLGRTIAQVGRDRLVISTKFGYDFYNDAGDSGHRERRQDFSPAFVRFELEKSLDRMGIDCIDLYQAHNIKLPQYRDDLFELMGRLKQEGKIRYWGVALGPAIGWREEGYEALMDRGADTVQTVFNLYEQDPGREFCRIAQRIGRGGVIARVPTNSGILDEEFASEDHQFPSWDHRKFRDRNWLVYGLKKNDILRPIARQHGCSIRHLAMRWLASQPGLVSIEPNIVGPADLRDYADACDGQSLDEATMRRIEQLYANDFYLGEEAHPCDWKSSVMPGGKVRSRYQEPIFQQ